MSEEKKDIMYYAKVVGTISGVLAPLGIWLNSYISEVKESEYNRGKLEAAQLQTQEYNEAIRNSIIVAAERDVCCSDGD